MPILERTALQMATGRILDVGAGSGCHALALQEMGKDVCAIDISPLSVEVMKQRGVNDPRLINLFDETFSETFDTILMLMNGSGIIGRLNNMPEFFQRMKRILHPGGCIFMDSSDLRYLFEEEDGSIVIDLAGDYYGEIDFQMQYKDVKGDTFDWLYVDFQTLSLYASECGFKAELIKDIWPERSTSNAAREATGYISRITACVANNDFRQLIKEEAGSWSSLLLNHLLL